MLLKSFASNPAVGFDRSMVYRSAWIRNSSHSYDITAASSLRRLLPGQHLLVRGSRRKRNPNNCEIKCPRKEYIGKQNRIIDAAPVRFQISFSGISHFSFSFKTIPKLQLPLKNLVGWRRVGGGGRGRTGKMFAADWRRPQHRRVAKCCSSSAVSVLKKRQVAMFLLLVFTGNWVTQSILRVHPHVEFKTPPSWVWRLHSHPSSTSIQSRLQMETASDQALVSQILLVPQEKLSLWCSTVRMGSVLGFTTNIWIRPSMEYHGEETPQKFRIKISQKLFNTIRMVWCI